MTGVPAVPWGVNVSLEQYDEADAGRALAMIREAGFRWIRQRFPWDEIEPEPQAYRWEKWDRLVEWARQHDLTIIAVLDGAPLWARREPDRENPLAPPDNVNVYAGWVAAFVTRYQQSIRAYQIWDEPNIWPHWGDRPADPAGYVHLLSASYKAIKNVDPAAWVISAGLAPTTEDSKRNMSEVFYLRGMYDAGAAPYFDILGAKPYGFWSGPEDRRVSERVLNYSRLILLREEMIRHGDGRKAIWAVELGWNALPRDWTGRPAPWGTDEEAKQAERTIRALRRAREEWPWLGLLCLQHFQPDVQPDDPRRGFALVGQDFTPRLLYAQAKELIASATGISSTVRPRWGALLASLAILACGLLVVAWRGYVHFRQLPWGTWWKSGEQAFYRLSDSGQATLLGLVVGVYVLSPRLELALLSLWLILVITYLRWEWTLLLATLSIPFALYYRHLGPRGFSLVETFTLFSFAAWLLRTFAQKLEGEKRLKPLLRTGHWWSLDGAWFFFLLLSIASLAVSRNLAVSLREFRVVVLESTLFYFLIAKSPWLSRGSGQERNHAALLRFADALVLSGTAMAIYGLIQYFAGGDAIVTEGVRRMRGLYGSPNNLALVLGRILPVAVALAFWGTTPWRRMAYGAGAVIMLPCLFLTFSRGAWLLGLPAALLFLGAMRQRRALFIALALIILGILLLFPLAGTERVSSLFDTSSGTALFRLSLWRSAVAMIRDHLLTGVGLDNFLYYYPKYILPEAAAEPNLSHPHNIILDYWIRLGIGGLLALLWFLIAFFRSSVRLYRRLPEGDMRALVLGLMASMVNFLGHGLVDNSYFVVELAFIFALTLGLTQKLNLMEERT